MKIGKKIDLLKKDARVCLEFSAFNDFPDRLIKDIDTTIAVSSLKED
ncbi:hypothetical protein [Dubosiella newyorkensis]|nr:hypothetical protein [Dubosiella newyorkensis]